MNLWRGYWDRNSLEVLQCYGITSALLWKCSMDDEIEARRETHSGHGNYVFQINRDAQIRQALGCRYQRRL